MQSNVQGSYSNGQILAMEKDNYYRSVGSDTYIPASIAPRFYLAGKIIHACKHGCIKFVHSFTLGFQAGYDAQWFTLSAFISHISIRCNTRQPNVQPFFL